MRRERSAVRTPAAARVPEQGRLISPGASIGTEWVLRLGTLRRATVRLSPARSCAVDAGMGNCGLAPPQARPGPSRAEPAANARRAARQTERTRDEFHAGRRPGERAGLGNCGRGPRRPAQKQTAAPEGCRAMGGNGRRLSVCSWFSFWASPPRRRRRFHLRPTSRRRLHPRRRRRLFSFRRRLCPLCRRPPPRPI